MTNRFVPWPTTDPFPESLIDSVGDNAPDFPGSSGGREQGKFRPAKTPKLTRVAVALEGGELAESLVSVEEETLFYLKAIAGALMVMTEMSIQDLVNMADT